MKLRSCSAFLVVIALAGCDGPAPREPTPRAGGRAQVTVFAAASLRDVALDLGREFERRHPADVIFNFAASNTLAQQIRAAPRADVFLSADVRWVDFLEEAGRTVPGTGRDVLSNRLALVAHREFAGPVRAPRDLAGGGYRWLALADPEAVPAGRYARSYLERLTVDGADLWSRVADRVTPALDVRAALALVESDPEILGIVYATDAAASSGVRVLHEFPPRDDVAIVYRAVLLAGGPSPEQGRTFLEFLQEPAAQAIAARRGFLAPAS